MTSTNLEEMAAAIIELQRQVRALGGSNLLSHSSIEDGYLQEYTADGVLVGRLGKQFDGTHGLAGFNGPPPPKPSVPIVSSSIGGLDIQWDGEWDDADFAPMDFARVEVHASLVPGFDPLTATFLRTTFESPRGGRKFIALDDGEWTVRLVAKTISGKASIPSVAATGSPVSIGDIGGSTIFYRGTPPTVGGDNPQIGDLWLQTPDNIVHRWMIGGLWQEVRDQGIADALIEAAAAEALASEKMTFIEQATAPPEPDDINTTIWRRTTDNADFKWGVRPEEIITVAPTDGSAEVTTSGQPLLNTGWTVFTGSPAPVATRGLGSVSGEGTQYIRLTNSLPAVYDSTKVAGAFGRFTGFVAGEVARFRFKWATNTNNADYEVHFYYKWQNSSNADIQWGRRWKVAATTVWQQLVQDTEVVCPAGADRMMIAAYLRPKDGGAAAPLANAELLLDALLVRRMSFIGQNDITQFFHGDTPDTAEYTYDWVGTPYTSSPRRTRPAANGWQPIQLGPASIKPKSLVAKDVIATGTISAALFEAILILASKIVAGDPEAARCEFDNLGLRAYNSLNEETFNVNAATGAVTAKGNFTSSQGNDMVVMGASIFEDRPAVMFDPGKGDFGKPVILSSGEPTSTGLGIFSGRATSVMPNCYLSVHSTYWMINNHQYQVPSVPVEGYMVGSKIAMSSYSNQTIDTIELATGIRVEVDRMSLQQMVNRNHQLVGGGKRLSGADGVKWSRSFWVINLDSHQVQISSPAPGTVIPDLSDGPSATVDAAGFVPMAGGDTLWYVLEYSGLISNNAKFFKTSNAGITPFVQLPAEAIPVVTKSWDHAHGNAYHWGDGVTDDYWRGLPLFNGWVWYGGNFIPPQYKRVGSTVYVRGLISTGNVTVGAVFAYIDNPEFGVPMPGPSGVTSYRYGCHCRIATGSGRFDVQMNTAGTQVQLLVDTMSASYTFIDDASWEVY